MCWSRESVSFEYGIIGVDTNLCIGVCYLLWIEVLRFINGSPFKSQTPIRDDSYLSYQPDLSPVRHQLQERFCIKVISIIP